MSSDLFKKFVVDIQYNSSGSGTIFKPYQQSIYAYIITAKHIFFQGGDDDQCQYIKYEKSSLKIDKNNLKIIRETNKDAPITIKDSMIHFLPDSRIDFAIIIIDINQNKDNSDIQVLEIFDLDSNDYEKIDFYILGYPSITRTRDTYFKLMSYKVRHEFNNDNKDTEKNVHLKCIDNPILSLGNFNNDMNGLSGAGTYIKKDNMTVNLSHIQYGSITPNKFTCIRLDILCDDINILLNKINPDLPKIQTSTRAVLNDETLDFSEFTDFAFFEEKIKNNALAYKNYNFGIDLSDTTFDQKIVRDRTKKLRDAYEKISLERNALSYLYAHFAILSHKNNARRATTMFFQKAIQLNPEHEQIFLIEKAKRSKNIEKLQELVSKSLPETIEMYDKIINNENNPAGKIKKIKNAIIEIEKFNDGKNPEEMKEYLDKHFSLLEEFYEENKEVRNQYKYKELGDFYIKFEGKEKKAAFFFNIANELLLRLPSSENNNLLANEVKERLQFLFNQKHPIYDQIETAKLKAISILSSEEDKEVKKMVEEMRTMITSVYDDIHHMKQKDALQTESLLLIKENINNLGINIKEQIKQNKYNNLDIDLSNENNEIINSINMEIQDYLRKTPKEYNLTLNNEVKNEIIDLIAGSSNEINDTLRENNKSLLEKTNTIIDKADKQTRFILNDAKNEREILLKSINQEIVIEKLEPLITKNIIETESKFINIRNNLQSIKANNDNFTKEAVQLLKSQQLSDIKETLINNHIEIDTNISETKNKIINSLEKHRRSQRDGIVFATKIVTLIILALSLGFIIDNIKLY